MEANHCLSSRAHLNRTGLVGSRAARVAPLREWPINQAAGGSQRGFRFQLLIERGLASGRATFKQRSRGEQVVVVLTTQPRASSQCRRERLHFRPPARLAAERVLEQSRPATTTTTTAICTMVASSNSQAGCFGARLAPRQPEGSA